MNRDTASTSAQQEAILATWFQDEETGRMDLPQPKRWFNGGKSFDEQLRQQFAHTLDKANEGELDSWTSDASGSLALLVLLDQFSRNIYRGSAKAFAYDEKAQLICRAAIDKDFDQALPVIQRVFFYLPLEHAESDEIQTESLRKFTELHENSSADLEEFTLKTLESAVEHKAIIDQFGRYPHRNAALNRQNTAEEDQWLTEHSKSFGQ